MSPEEEIKFIQDPKLFNSRTRTKTQVSYSHYAFLFHRGLSSSHLVFFKIICFSEYKILIVEIKRVQ